MKNTSFALIAGLALVACSPSPTTPATPAPSEPMAAAPTTPDPATQPPAPIAPSAEDTCNKAQYAALIGKPDTDPAIPAASPTVRLIRDNQPVTQDFSAARLNIEITKGVVTGLRCG